MADIGVTMMHRSLTAFIDRDVDIAREVCASDDELDSLYDSNYAEVIGRMLIDSTSVKVLTYQLWTAHNLERIGDRSTNICERVIYLVTGKMEETNVSRYLGSGKPRRSSMVFAILRICADPHCHRLLPPQ